MRFGLLGSLEVTDDRGRALAVNGPKTRALLAALLTHANNVVSRDTLVDAVWPERPSPASGHGLEVLVSHLRSLLDARSARSHVVTQPGGYLADVRADELDVMRFEALVARALAEREQGELSRASLSFRAALGEWRGPAYGELAYAAFAADRATQLDELRLLALEELFECEVEQQRHRETVPELEGFVAMHPLRERARAALMLALYRSGRQADALQSFRDGAELLREQGLEPCDELRALERAILRHEPALEHATAG